MDYLTLYPPRLYALPFFRSLLEVYLIRIPTPSSVHYPWVVLVLCVVSTMAVTSTFVGFGAVFPFLQDDLDISRAKIGLISAGLMVGGSATSLVAGWLVDVLGACRLQALTMLCVVVGLVLFSQMRSFEQGMVIALLTGVVSAGSFPAFTKAIVDWITPRSRGVAMGVTEASIPVGGMLAALLLTFIAVSLDWRISVLALAAVIGLASLVFFIFYRDRPVLPGDEGGGRPARGRIALVLKDERIWLASVASACLATIMSVLVTYLVLFLKEMLGMSSVLAGSCLSISMAGAAVGRIVWGLVSDVMLGGRRVGLLGVLSVLSAVSTAFLVVLSSSTSLVLVFGLVFLIGGTTMGWSGLTGTLLAELAGPRLTGTAIGLAATIIRLGPLGVTPLFGPHGRPGGRVRPGLVDDCGPVGRGGRAFRGAGPQDARDAGPKSGLTGGGSGEYSGIPP